MQEPGLKTTYTLAEAAKILSCHKETLRRAIKNGDLQAARVGRSLRLSRVDLEIYWAACGGGDLFTKSTEDADRGEIKAKKSNKLANKNKAGVEQLSLLSTLK